MQQYPQQQQQMRGMGMQPQPFRIQEPNVHPQDGSSRQSMPLTAAETQSMLTRAGVSNFAQQVQQIGQQLQYLMERLHYAQNQVQTQAQGQLRELQQIEQAIAMTAQQLQQAQAASGMQTLPMQ